MNKRGQLTIFIIVALLIVGGVVLFFTLREEKKTREFIPDRDSIIFPVYDSTIWCLEKVGKEGIRKISSTGGYFEVPFNTSIAYFDQSIPYYYLNSKINLPSLEIIEGEISKYINKNLEECLNLEFGLNENVILSGEIKSNTKISEDKIELFLEYPIQIKEGESTSSISVFKSEFKSKFKNIYDASQEIIKSYSKNPGFICLTCNEDISKKYNVEINALPVEDVSIFKNDVIWYIIKNKGDFVDTDVFIRFIVEQ